MMKLFSNKKFYMNGFVLFVSLIASAFFSKSEFIWMPLTAVITIQTSIGFAFRQGMEKFFIIGASIVAGTLVAFFVKSFFILMLIALFFLSILFFIGKVDTKENHFLKSFLLAGIIFFIVLLFPVNNITMLYERLADSIWGATIGVISHVLIFPDRMDVEFRKSIIPIFKSYSNYLSVLMNMLLGKKIVESSILYSETSFPEWVYETGLNPLVRQGHRHFLVMVERVGQILFSMHYIAKQLLEVELNQEMRESLEACAAAAQKIMSAFITVLSLQKMSEGVDDFEEEIVKLEKALQHSIPSATELLDLSPQYIYLTALVMEMKDLRYALLQLGRSVS